MSKLKRLEYIIVKYVNNNRRIYLNTEKIPTKIATDIAENCSKEVAKNCEQNINNNYKKENRNKINNFKSKEIVPYWLEHPEICKSEPIKDTERKELESMLKDFK